MAIKDDSAPEGARQFHDVVTSLGRRQLELIAETHRRLFQQIEDVNQAWLDSIKETKDSEFEFTRRLKECEDPAQAAELCAEWMRTRAVRFLAESQRFSGLWQDFYSNAVVITTPSNGNELQNEEPASRGSAETTR